MSAESILKQILKMMNDRLEMNKRNAAKIEAGEAPRLSSRMDLDYLKFVLRRPEQEVLDALDLGIQNEIIVPEQVGDKTFYKLASEDTVIEDVRRPIVELPSFQSSDEEIEARQEAETVETYKPPIQPIREPRIKKVYNINFTIKGSFDDYDEIQNFQHEVLTILKSYPMLEYDVEVKRVEVKER